MAIKCEYYSVVYQGEMRMLFYSASNMTESSFAILKWATPFKSVSFTTDLKELYV